MELTNWQGIYNDITSNPFWDYQVMGNSLRVLLLALIAFLVLLAFFGLLRKIGILRLKSLSKKTKTDVDDTLIKVVDSIRPLFYSYLAFYLSVRFLSLGDLSSGILDALLLIAIIYQAVVVLEMLVDYGTRKFIKRSDVDDDENVEQAVNLVTKLAKILIWAFGLLMVLSNLGINVTSIIAGLGIGGIAIAFAVQNILEDLFSSFAIHFDQPFRVGDFIVVGQDRGVVEKIGIKTTRIRSLGGEELIISNKELTSVRVQNFKQMEERRSLFQFGVLYETPNKLLKEIPGIVQKIIEGIEGTRFERAHFFSFDDSALTFEVVYFVDSSDYNVFMDIQQQINLEIKEAFEKKGIGIAYPTRTVYLAGGEDKK